MAPHLCRIIQQNGVRRKQEHLITIMPQQQNHMIEDKQLDKSFLSFFGLSFTYHRAKAQPDAKNVPNTE